MTEQIEETEVEGEETVTTQPKKEKLLTQEEVNKLLAKERREAKTKHDALKTEYDEYKSSQEEAQTKRDEKAKTKVEALRKDLSPSMIKVLDRLSISDQLELLEDAEWMAGATKKTNIPKTPNGKEEVEVKKAQPPLMGRIK